MFQFCNKFSSLTFFSVLDELRQKTLDTLAMRYSDFLRQALYTLPELRPISLLIIHRYYYVTEKYEGIAPPQCISFTSLNWKLFGHILECFELLDENELE